MGALEVRVQSLECDLVLLVAHLVTNEAIVITPWM